MKAADELAYRIRKHAIEMTHRADASHIGGCLSCADILAVLYEGILNCRANEPDWSDRDRFVMSKGHCCAVLYAVLAEQGFIDKDELLTYGAPGSRLICHANADVPGVEWATGALGHGLGLAAGQAYAAKLKNADWHVYALLSDGELDEGATWEATLFAGHHELSRLTAIIDYNHQQALGRTSEVMNLDSLSDKFHSFGWMVQEVDGHDVEALRAVCEQRNVSTAPLCVIAHTVKGRGVAFMEDQLEWHYRSAKTGELLQKALVELDRYYGVSSSGLSK